MKFWNNSPLSSTFYHKMEKNEILWAEPPKMNIKKPPDGVVRVLVSLPGARLAFSETSKVLKTLEVSFKVLAKRELKFCILTKSSDLVLSIRFK